MPIYEYACDACGHHLEVMQSIKDAPLTQCPKCKKKKLQKLISAAGFQLKGTGWYVTDFRDKGKPAAKDKKDEAGGSSKSDDKAEAKSDAADKPAPADKADKPEKKKKKKASD
jgi:putative FmdB family regulatory protein